MDWTEKSQSLEKDSSSSSDATLKETKHDPKLYKTTLCNFYLQGACKSGSDCVFAHGTNELRDRNGQLLSELKDTNKTQSKNVLCTKFMSTGFCSYGEKCNFAHGTKELATNPLGKQQDAISHLLYKTTLCKNFLANNSCTFGIKCQFAHGHHELRSFQLENRHKRPAEFEDGPGPAKRGAFQIVKKVMCKHGDRCFNGTRCTFAHHLSELGTIAIVETERAVSCKYFEKTGTCPMGAMCTFEHKRSNYKTVMCRDIQLKSVCPRGQACTFAHSESEIVSFSQLQQPSNNLSQHEQDYPRVMIPSSKSLGNGPRETLGGFSSEWSGLGNISASAANVNRSLDGYTSLGDFGFSGSYENHIQQRSQGGNEFGSYSFPNQRSNGNSTSREPFNFKTLLCRDFERARVCPRALNCTFAHGENDLRKHN